MISFLETFSDDPGRQPFPKAEKPRWIKGNGGWWRVYRHESIWVPIPFHNPQLAQAWLDGRRYARQPLPAGKP